MIVTSETNMPEKEIYTTYHNLWHIEETFRIMKNELEARPVYLQKETTIKGHFLVCYLAVVLLRILQVRIFSNTFTDKNILKFNISGYKNPPSVLYGNRRRIYLSCYHYLY